MGKRTDKFIAELNQILEKSAAPAHQLLVYNKQFQVLHGKLSKLNDLHSKRVMEIDPGQTTQKEAEISRDPTIKKIDAAIDILNNEFLKLMPIRNKAVLAVKKLSADLDKKNEEFRQFLLKKSKSKNPFRSKKSLPTAIAFFKQVDVFIEEFNSMVKSG